MTRISEKNLVVAALFFINEEPGITTAKLITRFERAFNPVGEDAEILTNRNDSKFSQIVRNLKSHNKLEKLGYATYHDGSWNITQAGKSYLSEIATSLIVENEKNNI